MIVAKKERAMNNIDKILSSNLLPETTTLDNLIEFKHLMQIYKAGIKEISTKLEILDEEFKTRYDYNPIHHIDSRLKSPASIIEKLKRKNLQPTIENIKDNLFDIAGIRVVCNYIDDIYTVADLLTLQQDIKLVKKTDYIKSPKESGYRSLHLVVEIPIFLAEGATYIPVEIQIRTIAMDFWATLEHKLRYKSDNELTSSIRGRLKLCAKAISDIDREMQSIQIELRENNETKNVIKSEFDDLTDAMNSLFA